MIRAYTDIVYYYGSPSSTVGGGNIYVVDFAAELNLIVNPAVDSVGIVVNGLNGGYDIGIYDGVSWTVKNLKGPQGNPGTPGAAGADGQDGAVGPTGPPGAQGNTGLPPAHEWDLTQLRFRNPDGSWGSFVDLKGEPGADGVDGVDGLPGDPGATGPSPEHEWSSTQLRFQNPDGSWGLFVELRGPQGIQGIQGVPGADGQDGEAPAHEWDGTQIRFQNPNGSWGGWVDLIGDTGLPPAHEWDGTEIRFQNPDGSWGAWVDIAATAEQEIVEQELPPTVTPQRKLWRSTLDNILHYQEKRVTGNPFVPVRRFLSLKDFGAKGDGITDDTAAIQQAIDYCHQYELGFILGDEGTFLCNVVLKNGVSIHGSGMESTIFRPFTATSVFKNPADAPLQNIVLQDFSIYGDDGMPFQHGIEIKVDASLEVIKNISIRNIKVYECGHTGLLLTAVGEVQTLQNVNVSNSQFHNCAQYGVLIEGAVRNAFFGECLVFRNGGAAGYIPNAAVIANGNLRPENIAFAACYFDHYLASAASNNGTGVQVVDVKHISFTTCNFKDATPMLSIEGSEVLEAFWATESVHVTDCSFSSSFAICDFYLTVRGTDGISIKNSRFKGSGVVDYIKQETTQMFDVKNVDMGGNVFGNCSGEVVNLVKGQEIFGGAIYKFRDVILVDSEGASGNDDLEFIYDHLLTDTENFQIGEQLILRVLDAGRNITVKHNTGNIFLSNETDFLMDSLNSALVLYWSGTRWVSLTSGSGGGGGGSDVFYTHTQGSPATVWNIGHALGKFPSVTVVDSGGTTVQGEVAYVDANNLTITFSAGFSGKAYLN